MEKGKIEIYYQKEDDFAFTPFFYDPETCRGVVGPRVDGTHRLATLVRDESFNNDLDLPNCHYQKLVVPRNAFEELHNAAKQKDNELAEKIIKEKFPIPATSN